MNTRLLGCRCCLWSIHLLAPLTPSPSMSDRIIKLVFIRVSGVEGARKAVVPLVEGCDFGQFLMRVRRRLGLSDDAPVALSDPTSGPVDSIDRLLEVDEGNTLNVDAPEALIATPSVTCTTPAASSTRGPAHRTRVSGLESGAGVGTPDASGSLPECRLDVPTSEWARSGDGEDDNKYLKRRRDIVSLARSRRFVVLVLVVLGVGFGVVHVLH